MLHTRCLRLLVSFALALACPAQEKPPASLRVLFLGNSYTYYNDMPAMLAGLAKTPATKKKLLPNQITPGGSTLERLWAEGAALRRIQSQEWDYVVLQEQSRRPLRDPELFHDYARRFHEAITESGAKTVFYVTWSRKKAPETQSALTRAYTEIAHELGAETALVGPAWHAAHSENKDLELYSKDGSHPSPTGSYLAACVLYATLYGRTPTGLPHHLHSSDGSKSLVELPTETAALLQRHAWKIRATAQSK